jgi:hypothetical protein
MKVLKAVPVKNTSRVRITLEVDSSQKLVAIRPEAYYRLGQPLEDVVSGDLITEAEQVIGQKWEP